MPSSTTPNTWWSIEGKILSFWEHQQNWKKDKFHYIKIQVRAAVLRFILQGYLISVILCSDAQNVCMYV